MAEPADDRRGLPWTPEKGENGRFALILLATFLLFLPPAVLMPMLEVAEPERGETEKVPPRLAKLIAQPPPPEPVQLPEPEPELKPEPEPEPGRALPEAVAVQADPPEDVREPERQTTEQARKTASRSGLLAMQDQLAAFRAPDTEPVATLEANVAAEGISDRTVSRRDNAGALTGSGGVSAKPFPTRAVEVSGHQVREVAAVSEPEPEPATVARAGSGSEERGMSNIRKVFDAQKTVLYSMYRRELRQDPTLEGKVLLELVIEPDGTVSRCEVVSSELDNPELETRIATRVRLFNFGAADVATRKLRFPIDFLPG